MSGINHLHPAKESNMNFLGIHATPVNHRYWISNRLLAEGEGQRRGRTGLRAMESPRGGSPVENLVDEPAAAPSASSPQNEQSHATKEEWRADEDVTALCREAASMLGPDEMIHDSEFSLYGAMSALELMDAKMDKAPPVLQVRTLYVSVM